MPAAVVINKTPFALVGARIFDGGRFRDGHAVIIADGRIVEVVPTVALSADVEVRRVAGILAPGFIDTQVNGGGGVLFNDGPAVATIATIGRVHRRFGTTGFLPTLVSDAPERMATAVGAVQEAMVAGVPGVLGIHLEGPFLNSERAGAHERHWIRPITEADLVLLTTAGRGVVLVTLAPEIVAPAMIARMTAAGVVVAAGHTMASANQIAAVRTAGLTGFTHLFNAMPPMSARQPGPVGFALADRTAWVSLIADLNHVSATSLNVAIAARGVERTILVTDAMPTVGTELDSFTLVGRRVSRSGGRLITDDGRLAGSDLDMATAVRNVVRELAVPLAAALHMASLAPAEFLGLGHELGRIAPGYRASLVLLDDHLRAQATWIDGI